MPKKLVIIHGWSDCSESFNELKQVFSQKYEADNIYFVDYESREDNMSYNDVVDGIKDQFIENNLIDMEMTCPVGDSLDVIVHSTGGLVIREFISRFYSDDISKCPIKRIVMLAPANFGSPLAHLGKSTLGSFATGRKELTNFFETGKQILNGLELGSAYQWDLANRDVLNTTQFYSSSDIQVTVLVGIGQYGGIRQVVNRKGTDGTVVISGCNLNSVRYLFDFSTGQYKWDDSQSISETAFGVFPDVNHSTIVTSACEADSAVHKFLMKALSTETASDYVDLIHELRALNKTTYRNSSEPRYQQFLIKVVDDFNTPVNDYRIEFFVSTHEETRANRRTKFGFLDLSRLTNPMLRYSDEISYMICDQFHRYSENLSYRRFIVDNDSVSKRLKEIAGELQKDIVLSLKIHLPNIDQGIRYKTEQLENIVIYDPIHDYEDEPVIFFPNTTTMLEFKVNRYNNYVHVSKEPSTQDSREKRYKELR